MIDRRQYWGRVARYQFRGSIVSLRHGLLSTLAASAMLAGPMAVAQQAAEATPHYTMQQLFDSHQAHYAAMIEGFNTATQYARNYASTSPTLSCDFYMQALTQLSDAQDDLKWIVSALDERHQDAASYRASLDDNAAELVKWKNSYARNCPTH